MSSFSCWPALAPRVSLSFEFIYLFIFSGFLVSKEIRRILLFS
jgi:hypothetical protein